MNIFILRGGVNMSNFCVKLDSQGLKYDPNELLLRSIEILEDICIHIVDKDGCTIYYSKGCEKIEQYKREDMLGNHISESYMLDEKNHLNSENSLILKALRTGQSIENKAMKYITKKGKLINVISSAYPIFSDNKISGAIAVFKDVSQVMEMSSAITKLQKDLLLQKKKQTKNGTEFYFDDIIGSSTIMNSTINVAKKVSTSSSPILIVGATGTGKELFAQSIHNYSPVSSGPFVAINCSSIPETLLESILFGTNKGAFTGAIDSPGLFEQAKDGTLFLDELNSTSLAFQAALLRVLETNKIRRVSGSNEISVNGRVISAMNINPIEAINKKQLRPDLYYRLSALTLELPSLATRIDDIDELIMNFVETNNKIFGKNIEGISNEALKLLKRYDWPGNIRQLKHCIVYSMNMAEIDDLLIGSNHLPKYIVDNCKSGEILTPHKIDKSSGLKESLKNIERAMIIETLKQNNGNCSKSAKQLNISRQNLRYRLKILDIPEWEYR